MGSLPLRIELYSMSLFGTDNNSSRLSVMQVVHFAHEPTNTYLTHIEIEQWYYYFTFFYNRFSSGNTILLSHVVNLTE